MIALAPPRGRSSQVKMVTGSRRAAACVGALAAVLFGVGTAVAESIEPFQAFPGENLVSSAPSAAVEESSPTARTSVAAVPRPVADPPPATELATLSAVTPTVNAIGRAAAPPSTVLAPPSSVKPPVTSPPSPQVETPPTTTYQPADTMWASLSPEQGSAGAAITVKGGGCRRPGGGVSVVTKDPTGAFFSESTLELSPTGSWSILLSGDLHLLVGEYTVIPACISAINQTPESGTMIAYETLFFTISAKPSVVG